jgi:hypothetical protein
MPSTLSLTLANHRDEISRLMTSLEAFGAAASLPGRGDVSLDARAR